MSKSILIIYGGTQEPIDGVRHISNFSSGRTGAQISDHFDKLGAVVTVVRSTDSVGSSVKGEILFNSYKDLKEITDSLLDQRHFDATIMLAAVSDYVVDSIRIDGVLQTSTPDKIPSGRELDIKLRSSEKLISKFKQLSRNRDMKLIGFKLTNQTTEKLKYNYIMNLLGQDIDYVVHNDLSQISTETHRYSIYSANGKLKSGETKQQLAIDLFKEII